MTLYSAIIAVSALIFILCASLLTVRLVSSSMFRKNVALPHGFSEGIMTGPCYPALIADTSLLFIQFASFIAFKSSTEIVTSIRMICYLITALVFFVLFAKTPALLAYWFGQNTLWERYGKHGKIEYSSIRNARLSKKLRLPIMNNQQLCKFSFYVNGKNTFFHPKKYVCKMTACEISALSRQVDFSDETTATSPKRIRFAQKALSAVVLMICAVSIIQFCLCGVFNEAKYVASDVAGNEEIFTLSNPSEVIVSGNKLFVYYGALKAANVYTPDGEFLFSVSMKSAWLDGSDFAVSDGEIYYRLGDMLYIYSENGALSEITEYLPEHKSVFENRSLNAYETRSYGFSSVGVWYSVGGERTYVISKPIVFAIFNSDFLWLINAALIIAAIALRAACGNYKKVIPSFADSPADDDFDLAEFNAFASGNIVSDEDDQTAAS